MIPLEYFVATSFAMFTIGIVGIAATRHFIIMLLAVEIALVAATLLATAFYYFNTPSGNIMLLLFAIWTIAASEAIVLIAFYRYLARFEASLDVTKLSKFRD